MRGPAEADAAFAANVKRLREARGMSLRELAEAVGVGHTIIHRIENGQPALLGYAVAISAELGVSLADMTGGEPCGTCFGRPPAGFACLTCGPYEASGDEIAATGTTPLWAAAEQAHAEGRLKPLPRMPVVRPESDYEMKLPGIG